jgi:hypothetical protein
MFDKQFLETVTAIADPLSKVAAFVAAFSGVIYILANKPLQRMAAEERQKAAQALADTQKVTAQTQLELANTNLELTDAKIRLAEIQERIQDRVLTDKQIEMLVADLSGISVRITDGAGTRDHKCVAQIVNRRYDEESARFATALREMFMKAGWDTTRGERLPEPEFAIPAGVTMWGQYEEGEMHVCGRRVVAAFKRAGITLTIDPNGRVSGHQAFLIVGSKPLSG